MNLFITILFVAAFILFVIGIFQDRVNSPRWNFQSAGLACAALAWLIAKGVS